MKLLRIIPMSLVALSLTMPVAAYAQDAESIYMRRPLPLNPTTTTAGFRWETTSAVTDLNGNPVDVANYCGPVQRRNTSICVSVSTGQQVATSYCGSTSKPPEVEDDYVGSACTFSWLVGTYDEGPARCTNAESHVRTVVCQNQDGVTVEDRFCTDAKPPHIRTVADYSGCTASDPASSPTVRWGAWSYEQSCSATATKTRTGTCQVDNRDVAPTVCTDIGIPLNESLQEPNYTGCSYAWQSEEWSNWSNTCGTGTRTREVFCQRSDGNEVTDAECAIYAKPVSSETSDVTTGCPTTPSTCYGAEKILTSENAMQDCTAFASGFPSCPAGTTQGDPGSGTCVSAVVAASGDNCAVRGFEASEASCDAGGTTPPSTGTASCQDECGESRAHGSKWCTAGTTNLGMRTSQCTNGSVGYASTISGLNCDSGGTYQCN